MTAPIFRGIVATLDAPAAAAHIAGADAVEIRADLWPGGPARALDFIPAAAAPVVFTCRLRTEGGAYEGPDADRRKLFAAALERGASVVDIEAASALFPLAVADGWPVMASVHDFKGPMPEAPAQLARLAFSGALQVKLVSTAHTVDDLIAVRELLRDPPVPVTAFAMGDHGMPSRALALAWGSCFTFTAAQAAVAPGQLALAQFTAAFPHARTARRHVALCGAQADALHALACGANHDLVRSVPDCLLVPYAGATDQDHACITGPLGALGIVRVAARGARMVALAPGGRPVAEGTHAAALARILLAACHGEA